MALPLAIRQLLYQAFDPDVPVFPDEKNLYVDLNDVRPFTNVVRRLTDKVMLSKGKKTCQIIAGHNGSGKTTELLRAAKKLKSDNFFAVLCSLKNEVDLANLDVPELILTMAASLDAELQKENIQIIPDQLKDRWALLKSCFLPNLDISELASLGFKGGWEKIKDAIKWSTKALEEFRKIVEADISSWMRVINDMIGQAISRLSPQWHGLVMIVDDLEKMIMRPAPWDSQITTAEYLFTHRHTQLGGFECHVIYTMPLYLVYSHISGVVEDCYGEKPPVVPMTKIRERPSQRTAADPLKSDGVIKFLEIIQRRIQSCKLKFEDVFASEDIAIDLVRFSGGQPSQLMILIREAISQCDLPIDADTVKAVKAISSRSYSLMMREEYKDILATVAKTGELPRNEGNEKYIRELLASRAILAYNNDEPWHDVNPAMEARVAKL